MGIITTKNPGVFDCILPQLCYTDWLSLCRCVHVHGCVVFAVRVLFNVLFVSAGMCVPEAIFLFLYRELPLCCLVWLDRSVSPGVIYCFHNFQSECCVLRRRWGGGGNLSSYRYSKVFFDLQTGLIRNLGGKAKSCLDSVLHDRRSTKVVTPGTSTK